MNILKRMKMKNNQKKIIIFLIKYEQKYLLIFRRIQKTY